MSSAKSPMRLPPLRTLRVRNTKRQESNPCLTVMSSVLACWASAGYNTAGCAAVEQSLRACMDGPPPAQRPPNNLNYHLMRFHKNVAGPRKQKGPKD